MDKVNLQILRPQLSEWGLPKPATPGSAGFDLRACIDQDLCIKAGERELIPSGIAMHMAPANLTALLLSRSGLGAKKGLTIAQGVGLIDGDYTGEIKVMLLNTSKENQVVQPGDRIAQLIFIQAECPTLQIVESLDESERGAGGFGSTGSQ